MSGIWNEMTRVLFVAVWGVLSLGVEGEEVKVHAINALGLEVESQGCSYEGKAHPVGFWHGLVKGWKEVTKEEKVYAESYQIRSKFLSKEQLKKLPDVLSKEWGVNLELAGMLEKLEKKETAAKRAEYEEWRRMAEARKMRLIYHHLLTAEQKKKFKASVKRRREGAK